MTKWKILYTQDALKDRQKSGYESKIERLIKILEEDPFTSYPPYEKLLGDMAGTYSRRINHQHRLVYSVYKDVYAVKIISLWLHYE